MVRSNTDTVLATSKDKEGADVMSVEQLPVMGEEGSFYTPCLGELGCPLVKFLVLYIFPGSQFILSHLLTPATNTALFQCSQNSNSVGS